MIYAIEFIFRRQYRFEKFNIGGIFVKRIIGSKLNYILIFPRSVDMAIVIYIP